MNTTFIESIKSEREILKNSLIEIEGIQRELEDKTKTMLSKSIRTKRQIEAMDTLIKDSAEKSKEEKT